MIDFTKIHDKEHKETDLHDFADDLGHSQLTAVQCPSHADIDDAQQHDQLKRMWFQCLKAKDAVLLKENEQIIKKIHI